MVYRARPSSPTSLITIRPSAPWNLPVPFSTGPRNTTGLDENSPLTRPTRTPPLSDAATSTRAEFVLGKYLPVNESYPTISPVLTERSLSAPAKSCLPRFRDCSSTPFHRSVCTAFASVEDATVGAADAPPAKAVSPASATAARTSRFMNASSVVDPDHTALSRQPLVRDAIEPRLCSMTCGATGDGRPAVKPSQRSTNPPSAATGRWGFLPSPAWHPGQREGPSQYRVLNTSGARARGAPCHRWV